MTSRRIDLKELIININNIPFPMMLNQKGDLFITGESLATTLDLEDPFKAQLLKKCKTINPEHITIFNLVVLLALIPEKYYTNSQYRNQFTELKLQIQTHLIPLLITKELSLSFLEIETHTKDARVLAVYKAALQLAHEAKRKLQRSK